MGRPVHYTLTIAPDTPYGPSLVAVWLTNEKTGKDIVLRRFATCEAATEFQKELASLLRDE